MKVFSSFDKFAKIYHQRGYTIIPNLVGRDVIDRLKSETENILKDQNTLNDLHTSCFTKGTEFIDNNSTDESDIYYLDSSDKVRLFLEKLAIGAKGTLKYPLERSINKIGHCLHDLNPIYSEFTYSNIFKQLIKSLKVYSKPIVCQSMYIYKNPYIASSIPAHTDNMFLRTKPLSCMVKLFLI
jgi:phytanoyl-CoA hydroxylase